MVTAMNHILMHVILLVGLPPLLLGVIGKTKALFAGRVGPPFLQPYYDLAKLFQKGSVFSTTTTWVFRAGPVVGLATALLAGLLLPFGGHQAPVSFSGDLILFAYLFGLGGSLPPRRRWIRARPLRAWGRRARSRSHAWRSRRCFSDSWCWPACPGR